jgi:pimeloyl-ACP methyl ester carboxylesterase
MSAWSNGFWSNDGLRLHYRDYAGPDTARGEDRPPILCIPGLTRNARDFEGVADRLAGEWRVICVDLRGRGESAYAKDPMSYVPLTYLQDLETLIGELKLERFILFGTSLGGLVTMLLAMSDNKRIAGALLNDIGPVLESKGVEHIRSYVGRSQSWPTWLHAARFLAEAQHDRYPHWSLDQWLIFAKRLCKLTPNGRVVLDYDMRIADPFKLPGGDTGFDMWAAFQGLRGVPSLLVRGELSDLLAPPTVERMLAEVPTMEAVTVPGVGHAPTLDEPEAVAAIDRLLARVSASLP